MCSYLESTLTQGKGLTTPCFARGSNTFATHFGKLETGFIIFVKSLLTMLGYCFANLRILRKIHITKSW